MSWVLGKKKKRKSGSEVGAVSDSSPQVEKPEPDLERFVVAPSPKNWTMLTISIVLFLGWTIYLAYVAFF